MLTENIDNKRKEEITKFLHDCGILDIEKFISNCSRLRELLVEENSKYNLTRIIDNFDYWNKHIADSASIGIFFKDRLLKGSRIIDIGCGAGFPSIVLALAFPNTKVVAVDSTKKKVEFVSLVKKELGIDNLSVITGRAGELKLPSKFDMITARAVGTPIKIFRESRRYLDKGGSFILYQTPAICAQLSELNKATNEYGIRWKSTEQFVLPGGESRLFLYSFER